MPEPDIFPAEMASDPPRGVTGAVLLQALTRSREQLARSIARNNLALRSDQITAAVNRILFPLLLLRIAGDRRLLPAGTAASIRQFRSVKELTAALTVYADALYADDSPWVPAPGPSLDLVIDDRVIRGVVEIFLSPEWKYDLRSLPDGEVARVLSTYLGRTIRRSAAHQAVIVDTHESVVAGGVVPIPYTLAGYVVRQALESAGKNRSPREILPLRVLDPACGSGTLLTVAFRQLLESAGGSSLTFEERREILTGSIHGLDVNSHAVAATRMLLFLELYNYPGARSEGHFSTTLSSVLGELRHTIICGNALIGPEIVEDESWMFCPVRDRHRLNPFSYPDRFPEIVSGGGFDAVVSNPPEGALEKREWIQHYFQRRYASYHPAVDRSAYFLEKSLSLVRPNGIVSCITTSRWLRGSAGSPLRSLIAARQICGIVDLSLIPAGVPGAGLCVISVKESPPTRNFFAVQAGPSFLADPDFCAESSRFPIDQGVLDEGGWALRDTRAEEILRKAGIQATLADFVMGQVHAGARIPKEDPFVISEASARALLNRDPRCRILLRRLFRSEGITRYGGGDTGKYYILIPEGWTGSRAEGVEKSWRWLKRRHPLIARHLQSWAEQLKNEAGPGRLWWESTLDEFWQGPGKKILFPARFRSLAFVYDPGRSVGDETLMAIPSAGQYLAGILNSRLIAFFFDRTVRKAHRGREFFSWDHIRALPVYTPDFDRPEDVVRHDRMEELVQRRIDLERNCRAATTDQERMRLQKKISSSERQIDALVYDLYGLTADEISVVESENPS